MKMNKIMLTGYVVKQPKENKTKQDKLFTVVRLAVKKYNGTDFINIWCHNKIANQALSLVKGELVAIIGHITTNKDKVSVVADSLEFLGKKPDETNQQNNNNSVPLQLEEELEL
jgi:single-stranded DNA-binding protein